ncbi:hypothetical protein MYP14_20860 [Rhodococcus pyridinivorans]|uniref:hypothetical protein n=1 Tax=Rhodococcus pyridinivorans TaxID=103816 RepID=UPI002000003A|nr:hypothetical protein [Rhodococcus pyridinivorans]UPK63145.1 hypothetical protein MYP14_20860 [Rhodococcus pyridinivorans]
MTETYKIDTAIGHLPDWAVFVFDELRDCYAEPIHAWLRLVDTDGRVKIVPAQWDADDGALVPFPNVPTDLFRTHEEAEDHVRRRRTAWWRRGLPDLLREIDGMPAEERVPSQLRERLVDSDADALAATGHGSAYEALVQKGYLTEGHEEYRTQAPIPGGGIRFETVPAKPCELTVKGRQRAGLDT